MVYQNVKFYFLYNFLFRLFLKVQYVILTSSDQIKVLQSIKKNQVVRSQSVNFYGDLPVIDSPEDP